MLNGIDWLLLAVIGLSALLGLMRGFVVEVLALVVWVAAFWLAFVYGESVALLFGDSVASPSARLFLAYAALFVLALVIGGIVTWLVGRLMKSSGLSGIDRFLGMIFGFVRGAALGCVLVLVLGFTAMPQDAWWQRSLLLPQFQRGAEVMRAWLPDSVGQYVQFGASPAQPVTGLIQTQLDQSAAGESGGDSIPAEPARKPSTRDNKQIETPSGDRDAGTKTSGARDKNVKASKSKDAQASRRKGD